MTEISRPWQGRTSQGALGDAGPYTAVQWAETWKTMIGTGAEKANRGVIRGVENELEVTVNSPTAKNVLVESGAALVQGRWYHNNGTETLAIDDNASGSTRIDTIILEADFTAQMVRLDVLKGTPGAGLTALTQSLASIWQIPIAYITLASGFTSVTTSMITDMREYANLPANVALDVTNSSGVTFENGSVAIWLAAGGNAVDDTTAEGSLSIAGVIEARSLNAASARVIVQGIYPVLCDELVAVGDQLETSTTSGQAQKAIAGGGTFARVLVANAGANTRALCYISVPIRQFRPACVVTHNANQTVANGATGALALNTEQFDNASMHDTVTNNSRVTIRRAGLYAIAAGTGIDNMNGVNIFIRLNGSTNILTLEAFAGSNLTAAYNNRLYSFAAGDYIEIVAANGSGGTRTFTGNSVYSPLLSAILEIAA